MTRCPLCRAKSGEYHAPDCHTGRINLADDAGRVVLPPTRRLMRWRDCGPTARQCEARPGLLRAESAGVTRG